MPCGERLPDLFQDIPMRLINSENPELKLFNQMIKRLSRNQQMWSEMWRECQGERRAQSGL